MKRLLRHIGDFLIPDRWLIPPVKITPPEYDPNTDPVVADLRNQQQQSLQSKEQIDRRIEHHIQMREQNFLERELIGDRRRAR